MSAPDRSIDPAQADRRAIERALAHIADSAVAETGGQTGGAIRYALAGGGKRLRGMLVLAGYRAGGGGGDASELAAAVEIVHAYSLVHDDLPCMDDDDIRRGRLSTHRAFSVRSAIAAGAAMIPLAARTADRGSRALELPPERRTTIVKTLMQAAGAGGMIGGQLLDLAGEGSALDRELLDAVHMAKTGALIAASVRIGALAAGAGTGTDRAFARYGECIGLAFQIMDDVLDVTGSSEKLGKSAGRDAKLGKSTYVRLLGVEGATLRARSLAAEGCDTLAAQQMLTGELEHLAGFIVSRSH